MKDSFSVVFLVGLMFYQNWKLASFAIFIQKCEGMRKYLGATKNISTIENDESANRT